METRQQYNGGKAWAVAGLLFLLQVVNAFDKLVMGLASVAIMKELNLSPQQYGIAASSFFLLYAISGLLAGFFVVDRVPSKSLLAILVVIWSLAQLPVVLFASFTALILSRILLGIGEGPGTPSAIAACHEWFTVERRNLPSTLPILGATVGTLIAGPLISTIIARHGWQMGFLTCGLMGAGWLVVWLLFGATGPASALNRRQQAVAEKIRDVRQAQIWRDPTIIAILVVGFCSYWSAGFNIAWLPSLIQSDLGFDSITAGWLMGMLLGVASAMTLGIAYGSQQLLRRRLSPRLALGVLNGICLLCAAAAYAAAASTRAPQFKLSMLAVTGLTSATFVLGPAVISFVVPAAQRARFIVTTSCAATFAGLLSPLLTGRWVAANPHTGYDLTLLVNAAVTLIGGLTALFAIRPDRSIARLERLASSDRAALDARVSSSTFDS